MTFGELKAQPGIPDAAIILADDGDGFQHLAAVDLQMVADLKHNMFCPPNEHDTVVKVALIFK